MSAHTLKDVTHRAKLGRKIEEETNRRLLFLSKKNSRPVPYSACPCTGLCDYGAKENETRRTVDASRWSLV